MYNEVEGEKAGSMDDRRLVERSAKSDMNAFRLLVLRYQRMVFSYLGHFLFPSQVLEDLSQETFMKAYRNLSDFHFGKGASFSTWLITIARNLALNERAKARRRKEYFDGITDQDRSGDEHGPQQILEKRRLKARIHAAINRLPEQFHAAVDAWKLAKRAGKNYRLKAYNKLALYIVLVLGWNLLSFGTLVDLEGVFFWAAPYRIPTGAMAPTLLQGDFIMADRRVDHSAENHGLQRGELIIFKYPLDKNRVVVKRIVGLPGDEITIKGKELLVNGKKRTGEEVPREERARLYLAPDDTIAFYEESESGTYIVQFFERAERKDMAIAVSEGSCFVLGDNRDNSMDSRHWGMIPLSDVVARAKYVYFSIDPDDGIRWERAGKSLANYIVIKSGPQSENIPFR